jgi:hypothetical protein
MKSNRTPSPFLTADKHLEPPRNRLGIKICRAGTFLRPAQPRPSRGYCMNDRDGNEILPQTASRTTTEGSRKTQQAGRQCILAGLVLHKGLDMDLPRAGDPQRRWAQCLAVRRSKQWSRSTLTLGDWPKQGYQIAQYFRLPVKRAKRRIAQPCNPLHNTASG